VGLAIGDAVLQIEASRSGVVIGPHAGRDLEAVLHADAVTTLGLAAGVLPLDGVRDSIEIEGDETALRSVLGV